MAGRTALMTRSHAGTELAALRRRATLRRALRQTLLWSFIGLGLVITVLPAVWMVMSSFKNLAEISAVPMTLLPDHLRIENYQKAIQLMRFPRVLTNSFIITVSITMANVFLCTWGGYTFSKLRWPGRDIVFLLILATMMIPSFLTLVPRYVLTAKLGMLNSYAGMTIPFMTGPFGIFLTKQFMLSIPNELTDAAMVDGASAFDIYWRVILPLCKPIVAVLAIFVFNWSWDDLLWGVMILTNRSNWTLPIAIADLRAQGLEQYDLQMAGSAMAVIPVLIVFVLLQKYIVQGVTMSGIKG